MIVENITILQKLKEARKLIEKEENWCQHHFAKDSSGQNVPVTSDKAVAFCIRGALKKVSTEGDGINGITREAQELYYSLCCSFMNIFSLAGFNDANTHKEVLELFDKTIKEYEDKIKVNNL